MSWATYEYIRIEIQLCDEKKLICSILQPCHSPALSPFPAVRPPQIKENPTLAWLPNKPKAVVCGQWPFTFYSCFNYTWAHLFWFLDPLLVVLPTACSSPRRLSALRVRKIYNYLIKVASDCFALFQVKPGKWGQVWIMNPYVHWEQVLASEKLEKKKNQKKVILWSTSLQRFLASTFVE